jgi:dTMP kinase
MIPSVSSDSPKPGLLSPNGPCPPFHGQPSTPCGLPHPESTEINRGLSGPVSALSSNPPPLQCPAPNPKPLPDFNDFQITQGRLSPKTGGPLPGLFITLEGGEGVGKSTQSRLLRQKLKSRGIDVHLTREPGGTTFGEELRNLIVSTPLDPCEELLLLLAARKRHVCSVIMPALAAGQWVICDRFIDSTMVYQGLGKGLDPQWIEKMHAMVGITLRPDITFVLYSSLETSLARRRRNTASCNKFDLESLAFHRQVTKGFHQLALKDPKRCLSIKASCPIATVTRTMMDRLCEQFPQHLGPSSASQGPSLQPSASDLGLRQAILGKGDAQKKAFSKSASPSTGNPGIRPAQKPPAPHQKSRNQRRQPQKPRHQSAHTNPAQKSLDHSQRSRNQHTQRHLGQKPAAPGLAKSLVAPGTPLVSTNKQSLCVLTQ